MTAPEQPQPRKLRPGQLVTFSHPDPVTGGTLTGHAVVLVVGGDNEAVTLAPVSLLHLQVHPDSVVPVKPDDVPSTIAQPAS